MSSLNDRVNKQLGIGGPVAGGKVASQQSKLDQRVNETLGLVPKEHQGGLFNKIKGIPGGMGHQLLRGLGALRYTESAAASLANEVGEGIGQLTGIANKGGKQAIEGTTEGFSFDDLWKQTKSGEGFGSYIDTGNKWVDRIAGLGLGVAGDPLTYLGGTGVVAKSGRAGAAAKILERAAARGTEETVARRVAAKVGAKGGAGLNKAERELAEDLLGQKVGGLMLRAPGSRLARRPDLQVRIVPAEVTAALARTKLGAGALRAPGAIADAAAKTRLSGESGAARSLIRSGDPDKAWAGVQLVAARSIGSAPAQNWLKEAHATVKEFPGTDLDAVKVRFQDDMEKLREVIRTTLESHGVPEPERFDLDLDGLFEVLQKRAEKFPGDDPRKQLAIIQNYAAKQAQAKITQGYIAGKGVPVHTLTKKQLAAALDEADATLGTSRRTEKFLSAEANLLKTAMDDADKWSARRTRNAEQLEGHVAKVQKRLGQIDDDLVTTADKARAAARRAHAAVAAAAEQARDKLSILDHKVAEVEARGVAEAEQQAAKITRQRAVVEGQLQALRERLKQVERGGVVHAELTKKAKALQAEITAVRKAERSALTKRTARTGVPGFPKTQRELKRLRAEQAELNRQLAGADIMLAAAPTSLRNVEELGLASTRRTRAALRAERDELKGQLEGVEVTRAGAPQRRPRVPDDTSHDALAERGLAVHDQPGKSGLSTEDVAGAPGIVLRDDNGKTIGRAWFAEGEAGPQTPNIQVAKSARGGGAATRIMNKALDDGMTTPEALRAAAASEQGAAFVEGFLEKRARNLAGAQRDFDPLHGIDPASEGAHALLEAKYKEALAAAKASKQDVVSVERTSKYLKQEARRSAVISEIQNGAKVWKMADGEYITDPQVATAIQRMQSSDDLEDFLRLYDKVMNGWKAQALMSPGFQTRNFIGAVFNNWLADMDPGAYLRYRSLMRRAEGKGALVGRGGTLTPEERIIHGLIKEGRLNEQGQAVHEVLDELGLGFFTKRIARAGKEGGAVEKGARVAHAVSPWSLSKRGSRNATQKVEAAARGSLALDTMSKAIREGASPQDALNEAHRMVARYHFDYEDLSPLERKYLKRVMPFYTWTRKNLPLQIENMVRQPYKYARWGKVQANLGRGVEQPDVIPGYYEEEGAAKTPFSIGGVPFFKKSDLPYQQIAQQITDPTELLSSLTPVLRLPAERWAGKDLHSGIPLREELEQQTGPGAAVARLVTLPGVQQLANAAGLNVQTDVEGNPVVSDKDMKTLDNLLPILGRLRRMAPGGEEGAGPQTGGRAAVAALGFIGLGGMIPDERAQAGELYARNKDVDEAMDRLAERGIIDKKALTEFRKAASKPPRRGRRRRTIKRRGRINRRAA